MLLLSLLFLFCQYEGWKLNLMYWCFVGYCMGTIWLAQYLKNLACWNPYGFWIWGWINCPVQFLQRLEIWLFLRHCKRILAFYFGWLTLTLSSFCFSDLINFCCCRNLGSNGLTGRIPPELGNLKNLQKLWLDRNRLLGSLPVAGNPDFSSNKTGK